MILDELPRTIGNLLDAVVERGLSFPIYTVVVSANGQCIAVRYVQPDGESEVGCEPLCEYLDPSEKGFRLPINFYFSDSTGNAFRAMLVTEEEGVKWVN